MLQEKIESLDGLNTSMIRASLQAHKQLVYLNVQKPVRGHLTGIMPSM